MRIQHILTCSQKVESRSIFVKKIVFNLFEILAHIEDVFVNRLVK